jgi:hypothetical protein
MMSSNFNPYAPPRSTSVEQEVATLGRAYRTLNGLYVGVLLIVTVVLVSTRPPVPDSRTFIAALYFYAPALCFLTMRFVPSKHWPAALTVYGLYVSTLLGIFVWNAVSPYPDPGIGAVIVGLNATALLAGLGQLRRARAMQATHGG